MPNYTRFLAILFVLLCGAGGVWAQELKPLPELNADFDLAAYAAGTDTIQRTIDNIPNVSFKLSLPKSWVERTTLGQDFGELIRFDGPAYGDVRPYFSFKRLQMNRENSARNELVAYMLKSSYTLRGIKETDDRNVEAFYVLQDENGDSFAVRAHARVLGASLLIAEYALPVSAWEKAMDEQIFAIQSFQFLKDSDEPIEQRIKRTYHSAFSFFYPASWVFEREEATGDNGVFMRLVNAGTGGQKNGQIRVALYSTRSLVSPESRMLYPLAIPPLLKEVKSRYAAAGYEIDKSLETRKPDVNLPVKFSALDIYQMRERMTEYETGRSEPVSNELWVAMVQTDEVVPRTFIVELMTPARTQDIYLWSVNTRAFEIILKSIQ